MKRTTAFLMTLILLAAMLAAPVKTNADTVFPKAGTVAVSYGKLNVRSGPSTVAAVVDSLEKGSYVTLVSKSGAWWQVEYYDNKYGYCHSDYIASVSGTQAKVNVSYGSLNVRSGAGTSYPRQAALYRGDTVVVIGKQGSWSRILYNGNRTGYVSSAYLSTSSGGSSGTVNGGAICLSVPSFKQNDRRWAKVKIGSSGKTISQTGCATTAIAMMESYRTGTTIYPDAMSKRLSYTSSGNVYWPGHYTAITGSSNLLSEIHSKLYQGKPVLFGAKNSYGGQHWVVITGFTGGSVSDSGAYTVNDPGSNSRSTLKQFLSAYPTFYKYFYY